MSIRLTVKLNFGWFQSSNWLKTKAYRHERSQLLVESSKGERMKSQRHGARDSEVEVTNISGHGFWLWLAGREVFISFTEFPWFADAPVAKIVHVEWPSEDHLYWPDLDVDLSVRSIEHPEEF